VAEARRNLRRAKWGQRRGEKVNGFGSVPRPMAEAQREIQAVPGHVDPVVVREETEIDEGVLGPEVAEVLQQPSSREGADAAERDHFRSRPCSSRSTVAPIRAKASVSTGTSASPSSVKASPRGNLRKSVTPKISSRPLT
jgi:hypothetical protein